MRKVTNPEIVDGMFVYEDECCHFTKYMLVPTGKDDQGRQLFTAVRVVDSLPSKDWKVDDGALTAPYGYQWITNAESRWSKYRETRLMKKQA